MIETNFVIDDDPCYAELRVAAVALLESAQAYHAAYIRFVRAAGCPPKAVVWVTDTDGKMVVLTRGEYRDILMENIRRVNQREEAPEDA